MRAVCCAGVVVLVLGAFCGASRADALSIYDVQYTTDASGESPYHGTYQDVLGGVVTHIEDGFRVYLQDPSYMDGWGAIAVKDWEGALANVQLGDWVSFTDVYIEDYRGTTFIQYASDSGGANPNLGFAVEGCYPGPEAKLLTAADLAAPVENPPEFWYVADRRSEPYESMVVTLENVTVGALDLGKADDNYELWQGADVAWGTDYFQAPGSDPYYDPRIVPGAQLDSITGIVEQYLKSGSTYAWDYYQVCTRFPGDIVPEPGSAALFALALVALRRR